MEFVDTYRADSDQAASASVSDDEANDTAPPSSSSSNHNQQPRHRRRYRRHRQQHTHHPGEHSKYVVLDPATGTARDFHSSSKRVGAPSGGSAGGLQSPPVTLEQFELRLLKNDKKWDKFLDASFSSTLPFNEQEQARVALLAILDAIDEFLAAVAERYCILPPPQFQEEASGAAGSASSSSGCAYTEQLWIAHLVGFTYVVQGVASIVCKCQGQPVNPVAAHVISERMRRLCSTRLWIFGTCLYREWHEKRRDDIIGVSNDGFWPVSLREAAVLVICQFTWTWNSVVFPWLARCARERDQQRQQHHSANEIDLVLDQLADMSLQTWGDFYDHHASGTDLSTAQADEFAQAVTLVHDTLVSWFAGSSAVGLPLRSPPSCGPACLTARPSPQVRHFIKDQHQQKRRFLTLDTTERLWRTGSTSVVDVHKPIGQYTLVDCVRLTRWLQRHQFCLEWTPLLQWLVCVGLWSRVCYWIGSPDQHPLTVACLQDYELDDDVWEPINYDPEHLTVAQSVVLEIERLYGFWTGITELSYRFVVAAHLGSADKRAQQLVQFAEAVAAPTPAEQFAWANLVLQRYCEYRPAAAADNGGAMETRDLLGERLKTGSLGYLIHPRQLEAHVERGGAVASRAFLDILGASRNIDRNSFMYVVYHNDGLVYLVTSACCESETDALELYRAILAPTATASASVSSEDTDYAAQEARATEQTLRLAFHTGPLISHRIKSESYTRLLPFYHQQILDFGNLRNTYTELSSDPELMALIADMNQAAAKDTATVAAMEAAKTDNYMSVMMDVAHRALKLMATSASAESDYWARFKRAARMAISNTAHALAGKRQTASPASAAGAAAAAATQPNRIAHVKRHSFQTNVINVHYSLRSMGSLETVRAGNYYQKLRFALTPIPYSSTFFGSSAGGSSSTHSNNANTGTADDNDDNTAAAVAATLSSVTLAPHVIYDASTGHIARVHSSSPSTYPYLISVGYDHWIVVPNMYFARTRDYLHALKLYARLAKYLQVETEIVDPITMQAFGMSD